MPERPTTESGGTASGAGVESQARAAREEQPGDEKQELIQEMLRRENMLKAYQRVVRNGGAPGVDGMTVEDLMPYCREHWEQIRERILNGTYVPQAVRRVEIPKPDGQGTRTLGIPTGSTSAPGMITRPPSRAPRRWRRVRDVVPRSAC